MPAIYARRLHDGRPRARQLALTERADPETRPVRPGRVPRRAVRPRARMGPLPRRLRRARRRPDAPAHRREPAREREDQYAEIGWNGFGLYLAAPTIVDHAEPRDRGPGSSARCSPARRSGASSSASPAPGPTSRRSRPVPSATATSGWSTARRSGTRSPTWPTAGCSSPAPTRTCRSTRASPTSRSTCTRRASRCGRWCRSPARRSSTRST